MSATLSFDDRSRRFSAEVWMRTHPWTSAAATAALLAGVFGWRSRTA